MLYAKYKSYAKTSKEFHSQFPNLPQLSRVHIQQLVSHLENTGLMFPLKRTAGAMKIIHDIYLDVFAYFCYCCCCCAHHPTSIKNMLKQLDIPFSNVWLLNKT